MNRTPQDLSASLEFQRRFTAALQAAGVPLLAGTDSPDVPGMYPGLSLHTDLRNLVASGLTPFQAMSAATRTAGEFIARYHPKKQRFGVIAVGARADLLLLAHNPLQSLDALDQPNGVAAGGRWFDRSALDQLFASRKAHYAHLDDLN